MTVFDFSGQGLLCPMNLCLEMFGCGTDILYFLFHYFVFAESFCVRTGTHRYFVLDFIFKTILNFKLKDMK